MIKIFERGTFHNYRITDSQLNEARRETMLFSEGGRISSKPTIFISHNHQDLEHLKDIIGLLQYYYNTDIYIDSMDANMPPKTCGDTAERIKTL